MALQFLNDDTGDLKNAVFCFTGKCPFPRTKMESIAIKAGASVTKSVTQKTTILVIADLSRFNHSSSKIEKSHKYGIHMIDPEEFLEMCKTPASSNGSDDISQFHISKQKSTIKQEVKKNRHSLVRRIKL